MAAVRQPGHEPTHFHILQDWLEQLLRVTSRNLRSMEIDFGGTFIILVSGERESDGESRLRI